MRLSAASFRRGLPTFPRHSVFSGVIGCLLSFCARILLFLNLFPISLFPAAPYQHQANQNVRATADTLHLPLQSQEKETL